MPEVVEIEKNAVREKILDFESELSKVDGAVFGNNIHCPLKHSFADGVYVREMFHPKGLMSVGKIHKYTHASFITSGEVSVFTEGEGEKRIRAPFYMISPAGTKRAVYAHEDATWITVHPNPENHTDISKLEDMLVANDYSEYEKCIEERREGKKYLSEENESSTNCGLIALGNLNDLKTISVRTLINMAEDNGLALYPYRIPINELSSVPLPAIFHLENHFIYVSENEKLDKELKYTGNVLLIQKSDYPEIEFYEQKKITGGTFVSVAAFGLYAAAATATGAIASSGIKKRQSKIAAAAAKKAQLINAAVEARKAEEKAKRNKRAAENLMYVGAAFALLGTGLAIFLVVRHRERMAQAIKT